MPHLKPPGMAASGAACGNIIAKGFNSSTEQALSDMLIDFHFMLTSMGVECLMRRSILRRCRLSENDS